MSVWPATRANQVLAALLRSGWQIKRQRGSHRTLKRDGWPDYVFPFHDRDEIAAPYVGENLKAHRLETRTPLNQITSRDADARARIAAWNRPFPLLVLV